VKKKVKIRKRILVTFIGLLFFAFAITGVIINLAISFDFARIAHILFASVSVMFIFAALSTYFLSNSITKPIEKLGDFAAKIGKGNFDANDFEFEDEELADLNDALNKSVKQLAAYDNEQKIFFQNASHELRTPLMSIKCYAEGIAVGIMSPKEAAETILSETDKLTELVKDLLYISQIDNLTTAHTKTNANLIQVIKECAARQQAMADKRNIHFVYDFDDNEIMHKCVMELISRAIDNLVANAIRYAKSEITLACRKKGGHIFIIVSDDGDGIEADVMPHIFERFYKGENGNTGIGLSIVKSIVEQHKGTVAAESANNSGAIFTIVLPA